MNGAQQGLPASTPECNLGELGGGEEIVLHFRHGSIGLDHSEVENSTHLDGDVVACNHILRRDIHCQCTKVHSGVVIGGVKKLAFRGTF